MGRGRHFTYTSSRTDTDTTLLSQPSHPLISINNCPLLLCLWVVLLAQVLLFDRMLRLWGGFFIGRCIQCLWFYGLFANCFFGEFQDFGAKKLSPGVWTLWLPGSWFRDQIFGWPIQSTAVFSGLLELLRLALASALASGRVKGSSCRAFFGCPSGFRGWNPGEP